MNKSVPWEKRKKKEKEEMLSLLLPGKGVREAATEIRCTQSCLRKRQKKKRQRKKKEKEKELFTSRDSRGRVLLLEREVLHTDGPKQMLEST